LQPIRVLPVSSLNSRPISRLTRREIRRISFFCDAVRSLHFILLLVIANPLFVVPLQYSHLAWIQTDRKSGGLGDLNYPLVADLTKEISKAYNVLIGDVVRLVLGSLSQFYPCLLGRHSSAEICHGLTSGKTLARVLVQQSLSALCGEKMRLTL
jgi:hypothetical protein